MAWKRFSAKYGNELSEERILAGMGKTNRIFQEWILGRSVNDAESARLSEEKEALYRELFAPHMKLPDGLRDILNLAHGKGIPCAVATGAPRSNVNFLMDGLALREARSRMFPDGGADAELPSGGLHGVRGCCSRRESGQGGRDAGCLRHVHTSEGFPS